ncbi:helix-turn-helix domain-containing protein [Aquibacillus halophilus]|uniref:Helix-turn-helix domain-containing protein n=1 Tax=Aquibacillus halophilus TaxID=930132 RepID=A0A6A8DE13_9BACI|nr:DNA-binding transcriptional regulator [Aquibacillus halophilus]MRH41157.1 helix-turn-helix domain-containing protein [Aquibacillus halophilus]
MTIPQEGSKFNQRKQVALIIETSNEYARGILRGVRKYIRENSNWSIFIEEYSRDNTSDFTWLKQWDGDGILARIENKRIAKSVNNTGLPIVDLSAFRLLPKIPFVETDDYSIVKLASEHFLERGFRNFAFIGNSRFNWSKNRHHHFCNFTKEFGFPFFDYDLFLSQHDSRIDERDELVKWLLSLPRPIAIMAAYDNIGLQILEACRFAKIAVPEEVAVIGVDNDTLITELSDPPLSSITPNTIKTGYNAALILEQLMNGTEIKQIENLIEPVGIATRQSSDVLAIDDPLVAKALHYIRDNAFNNIKVNDLLKVTPLSRRALEHRFIKYIGRTPHEEITVIKIKKVKELLLETDLTIANIGEIANFSNTEYLSVLFKKETGLTPSEYRKKNKT